MLLLALLAAVLQPQPAARAGPVSKWADAKVVDPSHKPRRYAQELGPSRSLLRCFCSGQWSSAMVRFERDANRAGGGSAASRVLLASVPLQCTLTLLHTAHCTLHLHRIRPGHPYPNPTIRDWISLRGHSSHQGTCSGIVAIGVPSLQVTSTVPNCLSQCQSCCNLTTNGLDNPPGRFWDPQALLAADCEASAPCATLRTIARTCMPPWERGFGTDTKEVPRTA